MRPVTNDERRRLAGIDSRQLPPGVEARLTELVNDASARAAIERERAAMRNSWESVVGNAAPLNGAHIGNFYAVKRRDH